MGSDFSGDLIYAFHAAVHERSQVLFIDFRKVFTHQQFLGGRLDSQMGVRVSGLS